MEEAVGKYWHRLVTRQADSSYAEAAVHLVEVARSVAIIFRALGGDGGLKLEPAAPRLHGARRHWLQRLAGSHKKAALAWRDGETLRLPQTIALYPSAQLNRDLYVWLAALAAMDGGAGSWLRGNQVSTLMALHRYPGLMPRYARLVEAELARRTEPKHLPEAEAAQERAIRAALQAPGSQAGLPPAPTPPQPVYLWLYPDVGPAGGCINTDDDDIAPEQTPGGEVEEQEQPHRYQAEQVEMPDGKSGLITMRWENIFSWAEYIKVNRATEEDKDEDAASKAADMDVLSLARDQKGSASRLRLDLDLPAAEYDDTPLGGEVTLPEWDWRKGEMLADHCRIHPMLPRNTTPKPLPQGLQRTARQLRGQFAALAQNRLWLRHQKEGGEIDMEAYLDHHIARHSGGASDEGGLYRELRQQQRDIATLVLADLSLSTDAAVNNDQRVIDVIRETLLLFAEALAACGDAFALYGFSSRKRQQVRFYHLKQFQDRYDDRVRGHIQAIRPGYYTRMGAAIRHSASLLAGQRAQQRLMLIVTDGKPNDLDKYEGRYGVEDTRKAILEVRRQGLTPFCITIDHKADDYLPHLFGRNGYAVVRDPKQLPKKLLKLYTELTHSS